MMGDDPLKAEKALRTMLTFFLENQDLTSDKEQSILMTTIDVYFDFAKEYTNLKQSLDYEASWMDTPKLQKLRHLMHGCHVILVNLMTYDI